MRLPTVLALTALALAPTSADAKCAMDHLQPIVLTKEVAVPADGGGIVVGTMSVSYDETDTGEALQKTWGFLTGRDIMQPVLTVLAPGLVVYGVQPTVRTTGELTDEKGAVVAKLAQTQTKVARLAAPKIKAVVHYDDGPNPMRRKVSTKVKLDGAAPADAVAMVLMDRKRTARSWGTVTAGATDVEVYYQYRCKVLPNGTLASKVGDKVIVAWVDKYGRLSATTKVFTIKVTK